MVEDADLAQARELLDSLYAHVDEISRKLEAAEVNSQHAHGRTETADPLGVAAVANSPGVAAVATESQPEIHVGMSTEWTAGGVARRRISTVQSHD